MDAEDKDLIDRLYQHTADDTTPYNSGGIVRQFASITRGVANGDIDLVDANTYLNVLTVFDRDMDFHNITKQGYTEYVVCSYTHHGTNSVISFPVFNLN